MNFTINTINHLLFIGIDKYLYQSQLNCCVRDCEDIKNILLDKYDFKKENVTELYNENATNHRIQEQLKEYSQSLTENDNLIIYYSGHGGYDRKMERGFWIPFDSKRMDYTTWLANESIILFINNISAKHIFLISDSCFSRSILIGSAKSDIPEAKDYDFYDSRWGLSSGAEASIDGGKGENSFFGETICNILRENHEDLRVSKFIEQVKDRFEVNKFQKPQGGPLQDIKHQWGEFVFKVLNDEEENINQVKGHKDFYTILQYFNRNALFKELGKHEDKTQKIGFQIFKTFDEVRKKNEYYLYLYEGINQQRTYEYLFSKHKEIFSSQSLIILIPKEINQINPEKRKNNIDLKFKPLNIFYIDDFIRNQCTPKNIVSNSEGKYLVNPNFIIPTFKENKNIIENESFFESWLKEEDQPIMVLKGTGGVGKTTFARFVADVFLKNNPNSSVLFLDSIEIHAKLLNSKKSYDNISVYNFYETLQDASSSSVEILNEDLFRLNLDAGNFLLIIDGLDEVISKLPKFKIDDFVNSIIEYNSDIGKGKVIITCRSYFWDISKFSSKDIRVTEILPFNKLQTKNFFKKSFPNDKNKIDKALKIAEEFKFVEENRDYYFHPYVLDVIRTIIESNQEVLHNDETFDSTILKKNVKNDFIIYRICYRERLRVKQISVDEQIKFFSYWAVKRRGSIRLENFKKEMSESLNKHVDNTLVEAFKSHPFVQVKEKLIQFRFDFFVDYFLSVFVSQFLVLDVEHEEVTEDFLKILSENCWFGSSMIVDIKNRIMSWTENELLKCSDLINQIKLDGNITDIKKRNCLAGLFNICLAVNIKYFTNNKEQNTKLLKILFNYGNNEINGLHIINMHSNEANIVFDFSSLIIKDSYIDNYQGFWTCSFDKNTYFKNCYLLNLEFDSNKKIPIPLNNFLDCTTDDKFSSAYKKDELLNQNIDLQLNDYLLNFFGLFYQRGKLEGQTLDKARKGKDSYSILIRTYARLPRRLFEFEKIIEFLKKESIIEFYEVSGEKKVKIKDLHKAEILRFINDGAASQNISDLISKLHSSIKK